MSVKVELKPTSKIITGLGLQKGGPAHKFLTDTCYKAMNKYVPMSNLPSKGTLRKVVSYSVDGSKIIYESPYAHAQYVGYTKGPVRKWTTPGTGPYWDKRMWSADKEKVISQVQKYVDTHGG